MVNEPKRYSATENIKDVADMPVYKLFLNLALEVEKTSNRWASDFRWLRVQVLRSSESVCANMAEGFFSQYSTEYLQALYRCRREAHETMTHLRYAAEVGQLSADVATTVLPQYDEALKQLANLIGSIERKIRNRGKSKPESNTPFPEH
jgi:four helix bundle protein